MSYTFCLLKLDLILSCLDFGLFDLDNLVWDQFLTEREKPTDSPSQHTVTKLFQSSKPVCSISSLFPTAVFLLCNTHLPALRLSALSRVPSLPHCAALPLPCAIPPWKNAAISSPHSSGQCQQHHCFDACVLQLCGAGAAANNAAVSWGAVLLLCCIFCTDVLKDAGGDRRSRQNWCFYFSPSKKVDCPSSGISEHLKRCYQKNPNLPQSFRFKTDGRTGPVFLFVRGNGKNWAKSVLDSFFSDISLF